MCIYIIHVYLDIWIHDIVLANSKDYSAQTGIAKKTFVRNHRTEYYGEDINTKVTCRRQLSETIALNIMVKIFLN